MDAALTIYNSWGGIKSQGTCDDNDRLSLSSSSDVGQRFLLVKLQSEEELSLADRVLLVHVKYI